MTLPRHIPISTRPEAAFAIRVIQRRDGKPARWEWSGTLTNLDRLIRRSQFKHTHLSR